MANWLDYFKGMDDEDMDTGIDTQLSDPADLDKLFSLAQPPNQGMAQSLPERSGDTNQSDMPVGMAESLAARSGDSLQQMPVEPPMRDIASAQPVPDIYRKEVSVSDATEQARPSLDDLFKPTDLAKAQAERDRMSNLLNMVQAAGDIGTAIGGSGYLKEDPNYLKDMMSNVDMPVKKILEQRKDKAGLLDIAKKQSEFASEKDKDDPNSVVSKLYRDTLKQLTSGAGINISIPDKSSAAELEKIYPNLINLVNAKEARQSKKELFELAKGEKSDKQKEKLDDKSFAQEKKLRDEVSTVDKDTNFSTTKFNYEGLKRKLDSGQFNGVDDIKAIYGFIKALDPGSVVRESETELVLKAESPLLRMLNIPAKITRGDIASPTFRKKLMNSYGELYNDRKGQFDYKVKPKINAAKKYKLDVNNILSEEVPGLATESNAADPSKTDKAATDMILIRKKSTNKMYQIKASDLEGYKKKNPNDIEVI